MTRKNAPEKKPKHNPVDPDAQGPTPEDGSEAQGASTNQPDAEASPRVVTRSISEWRNKLAIGVRTGEGPPKRDFGFVDYYTFHERWIQQQRRKQKGITEATIATMLAARMLTHLGDQEFHIPQDERTIPQDFNQRMLAVESLTQDDFLTMWVNFRIEAIGTDLELDLICPRCGREFGWVSDLSTMDVKVVGDEAATQWEVELETGVPYPEGRAKRLLVDRPRWKMMTEARPDGTDDFGTIKALSMKHGIVKPLDVESRTVLTLDRLDMVRKLDLETFTAEMDAHSAGVDFAFDSQCPRCRHDWTHIVDWTVDSFFSISSGSAQ